MSHVSKYVFSFFCLIAFVAIVGRANAAEVLLNRQTDELVIAAAVQADFAGSEASISAPDKTTVEVSVAGADFSVDGRRQLFRFEDDSIRTVSVSRDKGSGVIRFNVKEKNAGLVADLIRLTRADGHLFVTIPASVEATGQVIAGTKVVSISEGPSKIEAATEAAPKASLVAGAGAPDAKSDSKTDSKSESKTASKTESANEAGADSEKTPVSLNDKRPESEIPVFVEKTGAKKNASMGLERLVITLFVVCALLGAGIFGLKRWAARRGKNLAGPTKINILTQHHLGPKKSLAIIQVAGEAILIGITDQNISMLKTLALIDDEVPGVVPKNFADAMDDDETEARRQLAEEGFDGETDNFALRGLNDVRDLVSTRFSRKDM